MLLKQTTKQSFMGNEEKLHKSCHTHNSNHPLNNQEQKPKNEWHRKCKGIGLKEYWDRKKLVWCEGVVFDRTVDGRGYDILAWRVVIS